MKCTSTLLAACLVTLSSGQDFDPPKADLHINQTANGTLYVTQYQSAMATEYYQDDSNKLLHIEVGLSENNVFWYSDYFTNATGQYTITKADDNTTASTEFQCEYNPNGAYDWQLDGFGDRFMEWTGRYEMLAMDNPVIDAYFGPLYGMYPSQTYMTVGEEDNGTVGTAMYKGEDLLWAFGGITRYWYYNIKEEQPPTDKSENNRCKGPDSTFALNQTDNSTVAYDWLDNDMDQFPTQFAKGEYTNPRLANFDTDALYFHNATSKQLRIDIGSCSLKNSGKKSYLSYYYNATGAFFIDVLKAKITQLSGQNYDTFVAGMSGVPNPMAYVGPLKVIEHDNAETDTILAVFGGNATFVNGGTNGMLRYYDNATGLLVGIDIANDGIDWTDGGSYDRSKTGFARLWLDTILPPNDDLLGDDTFQINEILEMCKRDDKDGGLSTAAAWVIAIIVIIVVVIGCVFLARWKGYCGGGGSNYSSME